jgi:electron transfer DM13
MEKLTKNIIVSFILGTTFGGVLGIGIGIGIGIIAFPYIFPPPELNETVADQASKIIISKGTFIHAEPSDPVHFGEGAVTVYKDLLHLESDFKVGPGPKYHIYLVPEENITPETKVQETMFVDLGRLKAFSGSQNYVIPKGIELHQYKSAVIWCEQFNVLISPAALELVD